MADIPNYFLSTFPNYSGVQLDSEFRFYNYTADTATINPTTGFDAVQTEELKQAKTKAQISGDTLTVKLLDGILKYGGQALLLASQAGLFKNKNIVALSELAADKSKAAEVLARTSGNFDPTSLERILSEDTTTARSTTTQILGIPVTYFILGAVGFILYMLFKETPNKQKSKS